MIIAVASGKGGTGKTSVATSLALSLDGVQYVDCDVEEPNGAIFLKPVIDEKIPVSLPVPRVDETLCDGCAQCSDLCAYNALVVLGTRVLVFPQMCHGCGGCMRICPKGAIVEKPREIGMIEKGTAGPLAFMQGILNVGDPMATPIIKQLRGQLDTSKIVVLDSPPGTSCPVIESIRGSDFVLLATEATPFGLNDLKLAVEMVRALKIPFGVVINRFDVGDAGVEEYCAGDGIEVLMRIPTDRKIAEAYSRGAMIVDVMPEYRQQFAALFTAIQERTKT